MIGGTSRREVMSTKLRTTLPIIADQRQQLECSGLALETAFVDDGSAETLVMVYRVEPLAGTRGTAMSVMKFSAREFAIPNTDHLQLGTHRYYQEYEGEGEGIRDEMDGRFHEDISDILLRGTGLWVLQVHFRPYPHPL